MPRAKGSKNKVKLNDMPKEVIHANFLSEKPNIPTFKAPVIVAKEIPKMETIIFQNYRDPGIPLQFFMHTATHPLKHYTLIPGQTYNLPTEVVMHLEGQIPYDPYACHTRKYSKREVKTGSESMPEKSEMYLVGHEACFSCKTVRTLR